MFIIITNGLVKQWGETSNSAGIIDVVLPIEYGNTAYNIIAVDIRNSTTTGTDMALYISSTSGSKTKSKFKMCQYNSSDFKSSWKTIGF